MKNEARVQSPESRGTVSGVVASRSKTQRSALEVWRAIARTVRTIIGAPDYERYVAHVRQCHPDCTPLTREEFSRERLEDRYSRPGTRCC